MEIINYLNESIAYIETHLESELEIEQIANTACMSKYHFQRMFHAVAGITVGEYIRNRRLTLAAEDLTQSDAKVIDIAIKYGYDSPDAFAKAFQRLHGVTPSKLKAEGIRIKAFPKLTFQLSIKGASAMNYRILEQPALKLVGVDFETTTVDNAIYREIPEFCDRIWEDGTHRKLTAFLGLSENQSLHGIHYNFQDDGKRRYMIGWEAPEGQVPETYTVVSVPALTYAVFEGHGRMPDGLAIQGLWRRIYEEWFASSGFEQVEGPCLEKYYWEDDQGEAYTCEVWIPIKRK